MLTCSSTFIELHTYHSSVFYFQYANRGQISTFTADEVLISSPSCGQVIQPSEINPLYFDFLPYQSKMYTASNSYAQQCYGNGTRAQDCPTFIKTQLPQKITPNWTCPFPGKDKICMHDSLNLRIESGPIDSHNDLGINGPPEDRFTHRNVLECAPLQTNAYKEIVGSTENDSVVLLHYGPVINETNETGNMSFSWPVRVPLNLRDYSIQ